jgi:DNA mismatch repair ATPase MutS
LPAATRVVNDVVVGPPGTFLLVTGSNMSGKSTLLRAIGVNVVLAGAGGPVCAGGLRLPPVALWTSVRVQDSLERGVSYFMAELQRLKLVVDAARLQHERGGTQRVPSLLYLLDEILQGTNTVERQIAARRIIAFLVASGAIGAVSTHDLALADAPELSAGTRPVHFTDTVGDGAGRPVMSFDYRLRPGVATTTNALRLMELVGLDLDGMETIPPVVDVDLARRRATD